MEVEVIHGQIIAKANHYQAVPGKSGTKRIIKDEKIRAYEHSLKTLLDCLQMVGAIEDDKLCFQIEAEKKIDKYHPRIEFALLEVNEQKQIFY